MLARSACLFALTTVSATACGDTTPQAREPVRPGPVMARTAPAPNPPPRPTAPSAPANATPSATATRVTAPPVEPGQHCALDGVAEFAPNTPIQSTDGHVIGRFSGAPSHLAVTVLTFGSPPRAEVETGGARASFRLRGDVLAKDLPLFTAASVPIAAGHLAIGEHRAVSVTSVSSDRLKIERVASAPLARTFTAWTTCGALSLEAGTPPGWSPPGDARGYALRKDTLELFDGPDGAAVGVVERAPSAASVLFFGTEQSGAFVHVEHRADIVIDAWARANGLTALPRGETLDQAEPSETRRSAPHLALANEPRVVRTTREVTLRAETRELAPSIGVIGVDTETYVIDVMAGWASVMPKAMDVIPPDGGAFWAKKADLGL